MQRYGSMLKVQTSNGKIYEGEIYAIDPVTKSVALKHEGLYTVVNASVITEIHGNIGNCRTPNLPELGLRFETVFF